MRLITPAELMLLALTLSAGVAGCSCRSGSVARPYPTPSAQNLLSDLDAARQSARSYQIDSLMDYWVDDDRVKGTVLLMGQAGAFVRINALSPTGGNVAADLACNGRDFKYIDYNHNCYLTGPCNKASIARLLRMSLEPDDFLLLAMGLTPMLPYTQSAVTWDGDHCHEVLTLTARDGSAVQTITLSGCHCEGKLPGTSAGSCPWDVVSSEVRDVDGNQLWTLRNKGFSTVRGEDGVVFRVPEKTQFKQPGAKSDILIRWRERTHNLALDRGKFTMEIPAGLAVCGANPSPSQATTTRDPIQ